MWQNPALIYIFHSFSLIKIFTFIHSPKLSHSLHENHLMPQLIYCYSYSDCLSLPLTHIRTHARTHTHAHSMLTMPKKNSITKKKQMYWLNVNCKCRPTVNTREKITYKISIDSWQEKWCNCYQFQSLSSSKAQLWSDTEHYMTIMTKYGRKSFYK